MNKLHKIILFALTLTSLSSQDRLSIYKYTKGTSYKSINKQEWSPAKQKKQITQQDSIFIPQGGAITILDKYSSHTYSVKAVDSNIKTTAHQIIQQAMRDESQIIKHVTQELSENSKASIKQSQYTTYGVSTMSNSPIEYEIASLVFEYIESNTKDSLSCESIYLTKKIENKVAHLEVTNELEKGYFYTVLKIDNTGRHVCYNIYNLKNNVLSEISLYVAPKTSSYLANYPLSIDPRSCYIVIASETEFSWILLERLLDTPNFKKIEYDTTRLKIGALKQ